MSHELRPRSTRSLSSPAKASGKVGPVSSEHQEFLGDVLTSSRHLLRLINDILDLAKVETGQQILRPEEVDLPEIVDEIRDVLRGIAAQKRVRVTTEISPDLRVVYVDASRLKQVLYAFLSNAVKFTGAEGKVFVRLLPTERPFASGRAPARHNRENDAACFLVPRNRRAPRRSHRRHGLGRAGQVGGEAHVGRVRGEERGRQGGDLSASSL